MRPRGEINQALATAWQQGPATVTQAAHRACVGLSVARYTATRMVERGQLVVVEDGRPAVLGVPAATTACAGHWAAGEDAGVVLHRGFWGCVG